MWPLLQCFSERGTVKTSHSCWPTSLGVFHIWLPISRGASILEKNTDKNISFTVLFHLTKLHWALSDLTFWMMLLMCCVLCTLQKIPLIWFQVYEEKLKWIDIKKHIHVEAGLKKSSIVCINLSSPQLYRYYGKKWTFLFSIF